MTFVVLQNNMNLALVTRVFSCCAYQPLISINFPWLSRTAFMLWPMHCKLTFVSRISSDQNLSLKTEIYKSGRNSWCIIYISELFLWSKEVFSETSRQQDTRSWLVVMFPALFMNRKRHVRTLCSVVVFPWPCTAFSGCLWRDYHLKWFLSNNRQYMD